MRRLLGVSLGALLLAASAQASGPVVLDAIQRERIALATAPLAAGRDSGEVAATGRVLDPTPLFDAAQAFAAAHSVSERSGRELARVRRLARGDENASARDLEVAEDEGRRARIDLDAARARLVSGWSEQLAEQPALGDLLASLARRTAAVARIDVPASADALSGPTRARIAVATRPERALAARIFAPAPSIDPVVQGVGWLVLIEADPPPVGTALVATLVFPERAFEGVVVPRAAVVRRGAPTGRAHAARAAHSGCRPDGGGVRV